MELLTFLVLHYCKLVLLLQVCVSVCAAVKAGIVKTAVSQCDRKLSRMTLMTLL